MKKLSKKIILGLILLIFISFATCDLQNPVIKKWWEDEPDYIGIVKQVPLIEVVKEVVQETIVKEVVVKDPSKILKDINIIQIEYILFSGESREYNAGHGPGGSSDLTLQERNSNNANILAMAEELRDNDNYQIILHGHANPVIFDEGEKQDLMALSIARASDVARVLKGLYDDTSPTLPAFSPPLPTFSLTPNNTSGHHLDLDDERLAIKGYGGGRNLGATTYAGLNRRVELILIEIEWQ